MKRFVCVFAVAAGVAVRSDALMYTTERLNDFAVRGGNGQIFVYGTDGAYGDDPSLTKEAVFDGNTETFFDPPSSAVSGPCWAGFELETPKMITRVRFYPRATYPDRLVGCLIQGANTPDFSDAVTLHTITAAHANTWGDETMTTPESLQAFKYVRIYGPAAYTGTSTVNGTCCGNAAEIEFYGSDLPGTEMTFPDLPEIGFADVMNGHMNFRIATVENTLIYQIQRKLADEPDSAFADHLNIGHAGTVARYFRYDPTPLSAPTVYRVRALNTVGASEWVEIPITPRSFLAGTWIGVAGSWGNSGATGDKVFDGNIATFYDPVDGNGGWTGYDFGEERTITGLAYMPRENYGNRMLQGTFQYASRPDFADARVFFTVTDTPGYDAITFVDLVEPVTARYVRFQSASDVWCNAAEIEWRPPVTELEEPPPLTVSISDVEQQNAVLTWELPAPRIPCDTIAILKGKGPGGPWIDISPEDISLTTTTFTDTGIVGYEGWYYTLAYRKTVDGVTYTGPVSEPVFFRRGHRLDVTVVSGFFQNGMSGLTDGSPYQGNSALGPAAMFDGNTSTFADIVPEAVRVGVDLAGSYGISFARVFPRSNIVSRPDGSALWGSNNTDDWTVGEQISPAIPITAADWVTVTVNSPELWRYVYLYKASNFYANVAELELYGWTLADLADELIAPRNLAATCSAEALTLTWDPALNAEWYLVERKVGQSGAWVRIAEDLTECRFNDASVNYRGVLHAYRVVAVRGDEQACSATLELIPYVTGNGTGLYATYYSNASLAYTPDETVAGTRVDPTIDFGWGSGGPLADLTDHFIATWTGKLIIPLPGIYTFTLETDDGATFRLDGEYLYNNMSAVGTRTFYRELTAGEHDIRIDYYEISGQAYCHLAWDGPVGKGPIPTSQLVPVPPEPLPEPWVGERTLGSQQWGYTRFNPDGSLTIAAAGMDFFSTNEGYHGIWQEATGNFCYTLRYQFDSADPGATKAMLQVRQSPFSGAVVIAPCVMLHTDDADSYYAYNLKYRAVEEGSIEDDAGGWVSGASDTGWLRVKRIGPVFSCYTRTEDDGPWTLRYTFEDTAEAFGETLYIGPAVSRSGTTALDSVTYSRFTLTPADPGVLVILR